MHLRHSLFAVTILLAACADKRPRVEVPLSIDASSACRIEAEVTPCNQIGQKLVKDRQGVRIVARVTAHQDAKYTNLAEMIKSLKDAGVKDIELFTRP